MNIDLRFQDWSLVLAGASVRQYDDHAHTLRVTGDLPEGWQWKLYVSVFSESFLNVIPLTASDGELTAELTRDDLAFGDAVYTLQLVGERASARRHSSIVRLFVGASLSGDGIWPEVPRSFTDAETAALAAAERAEAAAARAAESGADEIRRALSSLLVPILRECLYGTDQSDALDTLEAALSDQVETFAIQNMLTNVTTDNPTAMVISGAAYHAVLTPDSGTEMSTVTVTMGGADITATAYASGTVTIASVTGDVVITAAAQSVIDTVTPELIDGYISPTTGTIGGTSSYRHTAVIPVREGDKVYGVCDDSQSGATVNGIPARWTAAYDNNGTFLKDSGVDTQSNYKSTAPYIVPSGVYGVVFSLTNRYANNVVVTIDKSERVVS